MASRDQNLSLAKRVVEELQKRTLHITTVESCTGGGLAYYITNVCGASDVMKDAFIAYSNEAKIALGVPRDTLRRYSVYSEETALAMAAAGIVRSVKADISVGITGSISRVDPNNVNSVPGKAYVGLRYGSTKRSRALDVHAERRIDVKDHIIESALRLILDSILS